MGPALASVLHPLFRPALALAVLEATTAATILPRRYLFCIEFVTVWHHKNRKTVPTLIVAAFAGLALIILLLKMGMSKQSGNEHAGTVKGATSSLTQVPDWTIG
jgi:hypothetical protein